MRYETMTPEKVSFLQSKQRLTEEVIVWEDAETRLCKETKRQSCRYCTEASCTQNPYHVDLILRR
jgi:hypothetical protein